MHVLLDANVPLNMWLAEKQPRPMAMESTLVLDAVAKGRITSCITPTTFSNIFYFLQLELGKTQAIELASDFLDQTTIIGQDEEVFRKAMRSGWTDVEDAAQYFAAVAKPGVGVICTCNTKHFRQAAGIRVLNPAQLLAKLK
ncbi:MAG: PIN domain-containing protein [Flavobacteriales bacterium]|nr:PIN domain-containing protein [Flavobacteriales bacterium]